MTKKAFTAAGYLISYWAVGAVWFSLSLTAVVTGAVLAPLWIGLPVLAAGLGLIRLMALAERSRTRWAGLPVPEPVRRPVVRDGRPLGLVAALRVRLADPQTWRDVALLLILWPALLVLDILGAVVWLICWALITLPLWYWSIPTGFDAGAPSRGVVIGYLPESGPGGDHAYGVLIDDLPSALLAAVVGAVLLLVMGHPAVRGAARAHARVVAACSGGSADARI